MSTSTSTSTTDLARQQRSDPAERLRDQAAACRRLASVASSALGATAMIGVAEQFEADANQMDGAQGA
jgi:hypothetical protein